MKRTLLTIVALLLLQLGWANPVTENEARQKAMEFIAKKKGVKPRMMKAAKAPLKSQSQQQATATQSYYAFNVGQEQGFVLVSGDDRTPAILGYSDNGAFDADRIPANMRAWLQGYEEQLEKLKRGAQAAKAGVTRPRIEPLLKSKWYQDEPYWSDCPIDPNTGDTCMTGCAATAMAQILNYYKYPEVTTTTIPAYTWNGTTYPAIAPTAIDWANMLDVYKKGAYTEDQRMAVAHLMRLCGQALQMQYSSYVSNAYGEYFVGAFCDYFGYDKGIRYMPRELFVASEWNDMIYEELAAARPVFYGGQSTGGGHAFVVDGYDADELFYVNWGWGGYCDGSFLLSVLDPHDNSGIGASSSSDGYSMGQVALIGIQKPQEQAEAKVGLAVDELSANDNYAVDDYVRLKSAGTFTVPLHVGVINLDPQSQKYNVALGVYDELDSLVEQTTLFTTQALDHLSWQGWNGKKAICKKLGDGTYHFRLLCKVNGTKEWQLAMSAAAHPLTATIRQDTMTVTASYYALTAEMECVTATPTVGEIASFKANVTNAGSFFNQTLCLYVNGEMVGGQMFDLGADETGTFEIGYKPKRSGKNVVDLCLQGYSFAPLATDTITVLGQKIRDIICDLSLKDLRANGTMPHNQATFSCLIHNNCRNAYEDDVIIVLQGSDGSKQEKTLSMKLAGDADSVVTVVFDQLKDKVSYQASCLYLLMNDYWRNTKGEQVKFTVNLPVDGKEDMSYLIENADFEMGSYGWMVDAVSGGNVRLGGTNGNLCFEAWNNRQFDVYQEITGLPAGIYEIQVQGFYRYQRYQKAWEAWKKGGISVPVYVYLNNSTTPLKNIFAEPAEAGLYSGISGEYDNYNEFDGQYFPNDMQSTAEAFSAGMYSQSAFGLVMSENDVVKVGVRGATNQANDSWAIWDNFHLVYLGFAPQYIRPALEKAIETADALSGQPMSKAAYENLVDMMITAEEVMGGSDGERMFNVLNELYEATNAAVASTEIYAELVKAIEDLGWHLETYHTADAAVQQQAADFYTEVKEKVAKHQIADSELDELYETIEDYIAKLRLPKDMDKATAQNPIDCTSLLTNPGFERDGVNSIDGWYGSGYINFGNDELQQSVLALEVYQNVLTLYQVFTNLPNGYYSMQVSAFYRFGGIDEDAAHYQQDDNHDHASIFMTDEVNTVNKPIVLMTSGAGLDRLSQGQEMMNGAGLYVPNDMVSAKAYFNAGRYQNYLLFQVTNGYLRMGVMKEGTYMEDWMIMDDFRLFYYGSEKPSEEQLAVEPAHLAAAAGTNECFDLSGRRLSSVAKGLSLQRQHLSDGTVRVKKIVK